jgi:hypothetical protein
MHDAYSIFPFDSTTGVTAVLAALNVKKRTQLRSQTFALNRYLREQGARTTVVERCYVDAGYLSDYANYYARCYASYPRTTTRLHYFARELDTADFEKFIRGTDSELAGSMQASYLGFSVLRPLPETIFGRTCLRVYPEHDANQAHRRRFPVRRRYDVSLFGQPLHVESVAFQEQDREVAACSTAAIWYALHGSPLRVAAAEIPSLFQITESASKMYAGRSATETARSFPSSGLSLSQIEAYFKHRGWECLVAGAKEDRKKDDNLHSAMRANLTGYVAAYLPAGNPLIVVGNLSFAEGNSTPEETNDLHAITLLGYRADVPQLPGDHAGAITRVYAHDDNIGPFCSYEEQHVMIKDREGKARGTSVLKTTQTLEPGKTRTRYFEPSYFLIPLDRKVRYPYESADLLAQFCKFAYQQRMADGSDGAELPPLGWDLHLTTANAFKQEIRIASTIDEDDRLTYLLGDLPKHLWHIRFKLQDVADKRWHPVLDLVLDATDISQGEALQHFILHDLPPSLGAVDGRIEERLLFTVKGSNEPYRRIAPVLEGLQAVIDTMGK